MFFWRTPVANVVREQEWLAWGFWRRRGGLFMTGGQESDNRFDPLYEVEGDAIVRRNGERTENRPLYGANRPALVLAGDRPFLRLAYHPNDCGALMIGIIRSGVGAWLHHFDRVTMRYRPNRIEWELSDGRLEGIEAVLQTVSLAGVPGLSARLRLQGVRQGDRLLWAFGGAQHREQLEEPNLLWLLDPKGSPERTTRGFVAEDCRFNQIEIDGEAFMLTAPPLSDRGQPRRAVAGRCSAASEMHVVDAAGWHDPVVFGGSTAFPEAALPLLRGIVSVGEGMREVYWGMEAGIAEEVCEHRHIADLASAFNAGWERAERIGRQVAVDTPDPWLDVGIANGCAAVDAVWYPPVFVHGAMRWNVPFPGWRTLYGPTAMGMHACVTAEGKHYIDSQVTESDKTEVRADPALGLTQAAADSRFYGVGRIERDQAFYNFQSVFFDMLIHAWRWTGDEALERMLRPALELHLQWARECFDPDDDGVYESYICTWATDSVWYNGGDTTHETSYAYRGRLAAADMARNAGDFEGEARHRARSVKIRENMDRSLWLEDRGHPAEYRDKLGLKRLHPDASLYTIFMPIDAGMWSPLRAVQALHYTEWALERNPMCDGESVWTSNWTPSIWSVRERYEGENFHLALAYFLVGLADEGWSLLKANHREPMYTGSVPGGLGYCNSGTDFNDVSSMFMRTVVEGLFGYHPDRPNGVVEVAPAFPADWDHAAIATPDFALRFQRQHCRVTCEVELTQPARLHLKIPIRARRVVRVALDGHAVDWEAEPGFEQSWVIVHMDRCARAAVVVEYEAPLVSSGAITVEVEAGQALTLEIPAGAITEIADPTSTLTQVATRDDRTAVTAHLRAGVVGHRQVLARVEFEELHQWQRFNLVINENSPQDQAGAAALRGCPADAHWVTIDMEAACNADVRAIFQQHYLSPRVQTCSVQLGEDGYSPWTFYYWKHKPPEITLDGVPALVNGDRLATPQGVPFAWHMEALKPGAKNIAFTSRWDNFPVSVQVPVGCAGRGLWLLVCGSTNPMQTRIANGVIRLTYADGQIDTLELVPPFNYWALCSLAGADYDYNRDRFALPETPPLTVQLGANCRAMLLGLKMREDIVLEHVALETLSNEVVIGLLGVTVMQ